LLNYLYNIGGILGQYLFPVTPVVPNFNFFFREFYKKDAKGSEGGEHTLDEHNGIHVGVVT
jgi:hypothetical protein